MPNIDRDDELIKVLMKIRTTHEVEHNDNQWTTEFVYSLDEAEQAIFQLLKEREQSKAREILAIGKERAENDETYQLWAFIEDMEVYLDKLGQLTKGKVE